MTTPQESLVLYSIDGNFAMITAIYSIDKKCHGERFLLLSNI